LKIIFLSQIVPYPPAGGVLQRSYHILREICKENEVHLMAFIHPDILNTNNKIDEASKHLLTFCKSVEFFVLKPKQSRLYFLLFILRSIFSMIPFSVFAFKSKYFRNYLRKLMGQQRFDIIHFDTITLAQYLFKKNKIPKTLTHHNIESNLMFRRARNAKNLLHKLFLYVDAMKLLRYEKKHLHQFTCRFTCSVVDKELLLNINQNINVEVIPNGVDTSFFKPKPDEEKNDSIVHIGALQSANLDGINYFLSEIWPLIKMKNNHAHLKIVGGSVPEYIKSLGQKEKDITVTGFVDDIRPYIWEASVLIVPLRFGGGTRLKILDALAMGKAVVSTTIGAEGIDVIPGKNIFIFDNPKDFAECVVFLIKNPQLRKKVGMLGRQLVKEKYDWVTIGKIQRAIFNKYIFH